MLPINSGFSRAFRLVNHYIISGYEPVTRCPKVIGPATRLRPSPLKCQLDHYQLSACLGDAAPGQCPSRLSPPASTAHGQCLGTAHQSDAAGTTPAGARRSVGL